LGCRPTRRYRTDLGDIWLPPQIRTSNPSQGRAASLQDASVLPLSRIPYCCIDFPPVSKASRCGLSIIYHFLGRIAARNVTQRRVVR
jgi:hypothetical protein